MHHADRLGFPVAGVNIPRPASDWMAISKGRIMLVRVRRSDIDFLVEFPPKTTRITHAAFQRELSSLLGCPVDMASLHGLNDRFRQRVTQEAIPL
ncbi:MAG: hypothetical protein QHH04_09630 [Methanolinea sp.]|nr:hypothetical protein [Methanolinea sp.]